MTSKDCTGYWISASSQVTCTMERKIAAPVDIPIAIAPSISRKWRQKGDSRLLCWAAGLAVLWNSAIAASSPTLL